MPWVAVRCKTSQESRINLLMELWGCSLSIKLLACFTRSSFELSFLAAELLGLRQGTSEANAGQASASLLAGIAAPNSRCGRQSSRPLDPGSAASDWQGVTREDSDNEADTLSGAYCWLSQFDSPLGTSRPASILTLLWSLYVLLLLCSFSADR